MIKSSYFLPFLWLLFFQGWTIAKVHDGRGEEQRACPSTTENTQCVLPTRLLAKEVGINKQWPGWRRQWCGRLMILYSCGKLGQCDIVGRPSSAGEQNLCRSFWNRRVIHKLIVACFSWEITKGFMMQGNWRPWICGNGHLVFHSRVWNHHCCEEFSRWCTDQEAGSSLSRVLFVHWTSLFFLSYFPSDAKIQGLNYAAHGGNFSSQTRVSIFILWIHFV